MEPFHSGLYAFYEHELHTDLLNKYVSPPQFLKESGYDTFGAGKIHHDSKGAPQEWSDYHEPTSSYLIYKNAQKNKSFAPVLL